MSETPDSPPATDEYGFAPTKIVRVRSSRRGGALRFVRVWMKPGDLDFPEQERPITGEELEDMRVRYAVRKRRGERMDVGLVMDAGHGAGGTPQNGEATEEGGTPPQEIFETPTEKVSAEATPAKFFELAGKLTPIEPRGATRNFVHFDEEGQTSSPFIPEELAKPLLDDADYNEALKAADEKAAGMTIPFRAPENFSESFAP